MTTFSHNFTTHLPVIEILHDILNEDLISTQLENLLTNDSKAALAFGVFITEMMEDSLLAYEPLFISATVGSAKARSMILKSRAACRAVVDSAPFLDAVVANSAALADFQAAPRFIKTITDLPLVTKPAVLNYAQFTSALVSQNLLYYVAALGHLNDFLSTQAMRQAIWSSNSALEQINHPLVREHLRSHPLFTITAYTKTSNTNWQNVTGLTGNRILLGWSGAHTNISHPFNLITRAAGTTFGQIEGLHTGSLTNSGTEARNGTVAALQATIQMQTPVNPGSFVYYFATLPA